MAKLCLTLYDPVDCSLPGSSVRGISQARILECVAVSFSWGSFWPRDRTHISCLAGRFFTNEPPGEPETDREAIKKENRWRRKQQPTPVFLLGKVHGQKSLESCSLWGYITEACMHEGGGKQVGSNKLVELKKKKRKESRKQ